MTPSKQQGLRNPTGAGDSSVYLTACGILVLAISAAYDPQRSAFGRRNGTAVMHAALREAQAKGYTRRDIFLATAAQHAGQSGQKEPMHPRVVELAHEVIDFIPVGCRGVVLATLDLAFELDTTDWRASLPEPLSPGSATVDAQADLKPRPGRGRPRKSTTAIQGASA